MNTTYEQIKFNNSQNSVKNMTSSMDRKEILDQIDLEILSKKRLFQSTQNTRSNYNFVMVLDLIALLLSFVGLFFVYNIFREQQIQLISGYQGVKVLQSTLLDQMNKQYALNLLLKEQENNALKARLQDLEAQYHEIIERLKREATAEIERQQDELRKKMQQELQGKSAQEQQQIEIRYQEQLVKAAQEIEQARFQKENSEYQRYQKTIQIELQEQKEFENQYLKEIEASRKLLEYTEKEIERLKQQSPEQSVIITPSSSQQNIARTQFDNTISRLFIDVQGAFQKNDYKAISNHLEAVQKMYSNTPPNFPESRKNSDLQTVELMYQYINSQNEQHFLSNTNVMLNRQDSMKFIDAVKENNTRDVAVQVATLSNKIPDLPEFVQLYLEFIRKGSNDSLNLIIDRGDRSLAQKQYLDAIQQYNQALSIYHLNPQTSNVIVKLNQAMINEIESYKTSSNAIANTGATITNAITNFITNFVVAEGIPNIIQSNVNTLLKESTPDINISNLKPNRIIYLKEPDGYIADILDNNNILVLLLPRKKASRGQKLEMYRINTIDDVYISKIGEIQASKTFQGSLQILYTNHQAQLGDLVYIKEK